MISFDNMRTCVFGKYVRIREINIREYISGVMFAKISSLKIYVLYGYRIYRLPHAESKLSTVNSNITRMLIDSVSIASI